MIEIKTKGNKPTNTDIYNIDADKQLLIAAWAYGLQAGDDIHRLSLYSFIQSHLASKTEENLQRILQNSQNWLKKGKGIYKLTTKGYDQLLNFNYDKPNFVIPQTSIFTFSTKINNGKDSISVTVDPIKHTNIAKQNGVKEKPYTIIQHIENTTRNKIKTEKTSAPRQILNWILNSDNYEWSIENFTTTEIVLPEPTVGNEDENEQNEIINLILDSNSSKQSIINELKNLKEKDLELIEINGKSYKRDNNTIAKIKFLRDFKCQICGTAIKKKDGRNYVEAAHIKPKHQEGKETPDNIILLCPNHHKEFDIGDRVIISHNADKIIFLLNELRYEINLKLE